MMSCQTSSLSQPVEHFARLGDMENAFILRHVKRRIPLPVIPDLDRPVVAPQFPELLPTILQLIPVRESNSEKAPCEPGLTHWRHTNRRGLKRVPPQPVDIVATVPRTGRLLASYGHVLE